MNTESLKHMLLWNRCVFMTHQQYKKGEHLNDNIYYHRGFTDNIETHIREHIKGLATKLPFKRVPKPIYILVAKHIQPDNQKSIINPGCSKAYDGIKNKTLDYDLYISKYKKDKHFNNYDYSEVLKANPQISTSCVTPYLDLINNTFDYELYKTHYKTNHANIVDDVNPLQCQQAYQDLLDNKFDYNDYKINTSNYTQYDKACFRANNQFIQKDDSRIQHYKNTQDTNKELQKIRQRNYDKTCFVNGSSFRTIYDPNIFPLKVVYDNNKKLQKIRENKYDTQVDCFYKPVEDHQYELVENNSSEFYKNLFLYDTIGMNKERFLNSSLSTFIFQGIYEVIIYIPNLNKDLQYFTSYKDFSDQNRWIDILINENSLHLNIIRFQKDYASILKESIGQELYDKNKSVYDNIFKGLNQSDVHEYPLVKDLTNICLQMGCSSEYGEDLDEMVPALGKNYEDQLNNARAKGPYFPTKCLRTDYYEDHMIKFDDKNKVFAKIITDLDVFTSNYMDLKAGKTPSQQSSTNIVDAAKGTFARYRNETYDEGKYSKEYNRKILTELALRKDLSHGVQEITFPAFRLNDDYKELQEYTHFMPWGNILLTNKYVLNEGDILDIEKTPLKSFNRVYEMKFDEKTGNLSVFKDNVVQNIFVNKDFREFANKTIKLQSGSLNIDGYEGKNNDTRYAKSISNANGIWPLSLILENDGTIKIYDNGFNVIRELEYVSI